VLLGLAVLHPPLLLLLQKYLGQAYHMHQLHRVLTSNYVV
jgi:hypothetical protein